MYEGYNLINSNDLSCGIGVVRWEHEGFRSVNNTTTRFRLNFGPFI